MCAVVAIRDPHALAQAFGSTKDVNVNKHNDKDLLSHTQTCFNISTSILLCVR